MKIIFMGTALFSAKILQKLIDDTKHEIIAIYTKEPKANNNRSAIKSAVHKLAKNNDIAVYTPKTFQDSKEIVKFQYLDADIVVVVAYGLILPKEVLYTAKYGAINIHPSALPRWRGAAPIERAIISGDTTTDCCIMQMDEGLDTGDVLSRIPVLISENMTNGDLYNKIVNISPMQLLDVLRQIEEGNVIKTPQNTQDITYAHKIKKEETIINWNLHAKTIHCFIRGMSPKPGAYFIYKNEIIKIITADYEDKSHDYQIGEIINDNLYIACNNGIIIPNLLQRQGKKVIYREAFLRGYQLVKGSILSTNIRIS